MREGHRLFNPNDPTNPHYARPGTVNDASRSRQKRIDLYTMLASPT